MYQDPAIIRLNIGRLEDLLKLGNSKEEQQVIGQLLAEASSQLLLAVAETKRSP
jgi:hypothetical protein